MVALMNTLLLGITGSRAYGLDTSLSDTDRIGVFAAPTLEICGLSWHSSRESVVEQGPEGDDFALHEVGKFCRLLLRCNPTLIETLYLPRINYEMLTQEGMMLRDIRNAFLSRKAVWDSYRGYTEAQLKKYRDGFTKPKYARHALRLAEQGRHLFMTGHLEVRVGNPQRFFDLADMRTEQVLRVIKDELDSWSDLYSPLPVEPDRAAVQEVLNTIRRNNI